MRPSIAVSGGSTERSRNGETSRTRCTLPPDHARTKRVEVQQDIGQFRHFSVNLTFGVEATYAQASAVLGTRGRRGDAVRRGVRVLVLLR